MRAIQTLDRLQDTRRFGAWLAGIARNVARERWRDRRLLTLEGEGPEAPSVDGETGVLAEQGDWLRGALDLLPSSQREALDLFYGEQLSYADIGERLGITAAAVNRRLTKARNRLRELEPKGGNA